MAERADITVDWGLSPRLIEVALPSVSLSNQDMHDTLNSNTLQPGMSDDSLENMDDDPIIDSAGKEDLGGGVEVGITSTLLDGQVAFGRTSPRTGAEIVTTGGSATVLVASAATLQADSCQRGDWVINWTDRSVTEILEVLSETSARCRTLSGGVTNLFNLNDVITVWEVAECELSGGNTVAVDAADLSINPLFTTFGRFATRAAASQATATDQTEILNLVKQIEQYVFVDADALTNGDGSDRSPFNNVTDAKDFAEANNIKKIITFADMTIDRTLKNFVIIGVGTPIIDTNGQDLDGSEFSRVIMRGSYTGTIIVQESVLDNGFNLNGYFQNCALGTGLGGDLVCVAGANVFIKDCASNIPGLSRPTISLNAVGAAVQLSVRNQFGGLTIKDATHVDDTVTVEMGRGSLTFDSSNTNGEMVARTSGKFLDETAGATVTREVYARESWQRLGLDPDNPLTTNDDNSISFDDVQIDAVNGPTSTTQTRQP
jgi:hypothetical protein